MCIRDRIEKSLIIKNILPCVYNRVKADPPESNIFEAVNLFQNHKADGVIGFGGGSSMDVAKAVSYFSINNANIKECYGVNNLKNVRCPLIQIPTTAGTGSEVTPNIVSCSLLPLTFIMSISTMFFV